MATSTGGTPYVQSSDLVSGWPTSSLAVANHVDVIAGGDVAYSTASQTATVAQILGNKVIVQNSASATVVTLPSSGLVNGMQLKVVSIGTGTVTFTGGTVTGSVVSIATQYTGLTLLYYSAVWYAVPFSSGSAKATVSATTGSPTITTVGSTTCYKFTGSGSITTTAGTCYALVVGGGGGGTAGGGNGGGGGGGGVNSTVSSTLALNLPAATNTVTVGAGGAGTANQTAIPGYASQIAAAVALGGGAGQGPDADLIGKNGASGGGGKGSTNGTGGLTLLASQGFNGGAGVSPNGGGGGGASAVGAVGAGTTGGAGGAGVANSITGSSVTYGGGGGGASSTYGAGGAGGGGSNSAGGANTGGGGSGNNAGGSGVVIIIIG